MVFGADTGVCIQGHVILCHDVIADHWIAVSHLSVLKHTIHQCLSVCLSVTTKHVGSGLNNQNIGKS